jgi:hypothetical protein
MPAPIITPQFILIGNTPKALEWLEVADRPAYGSPAQRALFFIEPERE